MSSKHQGAALPAGDVAFDAVARRLGENLRRLREAGGVTQEQVAERAGCAVRHVQRVEAGTVNVQLRLLVALAGAVGADVADLLAAPGHDARRADSHGAATATGGRTTKRAPRGTALRPGKQRKKRP